MAGESPIPTPNVYKLNLYEAVKQTAMRRKYANDIDEIRRIDITITI